MNLTLNPEDRQVLTVANGEDTSSGPITSMGQVSKTTAGTTMSDNHTSETNPFKCESRRRPVKGEEIIVVDLDADSKSEYEVLGQVLGKRAVSPVEVSP